MKKNIYLISYEYFPFSNGGLARHAKEIIDRAVLENNIYAIVATEKRLHERNNSKIKFIQIKSSNKLLKYTEFMIKTNIYIYKNKIKSDCIYLSVFSCLFNFLLIFKRNFSIFVHNSMRTVYEAHYPSESLTNYFKRKWIYLLLTFYEMFLCLLSKKIFVVSPSTKKDVNKQYKIEKNKIVIILNGLSLKTVRRKKKNKTRKLLYVGRLVPRKNILELILIFRKIIEKDNSFKLSLVGDGEKMYIDKIKKIIKELNLDKNITLCGKVNDKKLVEIYKKSDLFLFTSLVEGFWLVVLEAMSQWLPVVAYNISGVNDIIINNKNGYLIKKQDLEDFSKKVLRIFQNNKLYGRLQKNALSTSQLYDWDKSVNKFLSQISDSHKNEPI